MASVKLIDSLLALFVSFIPCVLF